MENGLRRNFPVLPFDPTFDPRFRVDSRYTSMRGLSSLQLLALSNSES